jgi:hypothetical protein
MVSFLDRKLIGKRRLWIHPTFNPLPGSEKICEHAGRAIRVIRAYPRLADTQVRGGEGAGEAEGYTVDVSCKTATSLMSERWLYCVPKIAACEEEVDVSCNRGDSLLAFEPVEYHGWSLGLNTGQWLKWHSLVRKLLKCF